jgi:hypothetical protein
MKFRTFALAMALGLALTAGAEAKKKGPHSTPPTVKSMNKGKKFKPAVKGHKVKHRKMAKAHKVNR